MSNVVDNSEVGHLNFAGIYPGIFDGVKAIDLLCTSRESWSLVNVAGLDTYAEYASKYLPPDRAQEILEKSSISNVRVFDAIVQRIKEIIGEGLVSEEQVTEINDEVRKARSLIFEDQ